MTNKPKVVAFLPCRQGSQRVPNKNIRPFGKFDNGLLEIKLNQLLAVEEIDQIVLSTNDAQIIDYASSLKTNKLDIHKRSEHLATSETSTDDIVKLALDLIPDAHILWTHVTSPFINAKVYAEIISKYLSVLKSGHDSLMTTTSIHGFIWDDNGPTNYDREVEKWPRTQTIAPLHEVNSGAFLSSSENYKLYNDRIGQNPYLYDLNKIVGFDIDWQEDFKIAEYMLNSGLIEV